MERENKRIIPDWENVDKYLGKESEDAIKLAIIEADKVFLKIVNKKGYKAKNLDKKISLAVQEISNPEPFLKTRELALNLKEKVGFDVGDVYSGEELINTYRKAIEDLIYGEISEEKLKSLKYRFWPFYYYVLLNSRKILKILLWIILVIVLMLFIADTTLGKTLFDFFIDKIHFALRIILAILLIIFAIAFFIVLFIVVLESKGRRGSGPKK